MYRSNTYYYTDDEVAVELKEREKQLTEEISRLKEKLTETKLPEPIKELTIEDVKKMNYWQFRKWKLGK